MSSTLLKGTWKGRGQVLKATGEVVAHYLETATFEPTRKTPSFVVYRVHQDTQNATTGKPMHTETGFLKIMTMNDGGDGNGAATMGLTHPFPSGMVQEMSTGTWNAVDRQLTLTAQKLSRLDNTDDSNNSKPVTGFKRVYTLVQDDKVIYDQFMGAGGGEMYHHLHCEMEKVVDQTEN